MRFIFKTDYRQDLALFQHNGARFWYGLLALLLLTAPLWLDGFYVGEISYVLVLAVAGIGIMLLTGFTGLVSLGHAAFLGIGAYAHGYFLKIGLPFVVSVPLATLLTAAVGLIVGLPALRLTGIYLAIATLLFAVIIEQVFIRWEAVTNGFRGFSVPTPRIFDTPLTDPTVFYYLCLVILTLAMLGAINLLRSPTGRAFVAIRDSEIAARSMGVHLARYKSMAFAISAGFTGLAGCLFAHKIGYLAPDAFGIILSIQLLLMAVIGGLGSLHGVIYGAIFVGALPQAIALVRDYLPEKIAQAPSLEPGVFGVMLVLLILFEPQGIYGRWRKVKLYFELFPMYKTATFRRQKSYARSERNK
jgi:branched-chain amino acid transport system permease protein